MPDYYEQQKIEREEARKVAEAREAQERRTIIRGAIVFVSTIAVLGTGFLWGCPQYRVYSKRQSGMAALAEATSNRQIATLEAKAKMESAKDLAATDTIRAMGVARSNAIIGQSLEKNEKYLTWLFIEALKEGKNDVIYIPTEASLPILEAGRLGKPAPTVIVK